MPSTKHERRGECRPFHSPLRTAARVLLAALPALGLGVAAPAQTIPANHAVLEGSVASAFPFGRGTLGGRTQNIYDSSEFTAAGLTGPVEIHSIAFRANGLNGLVGGNNALVSCTVGLAAVDYLAMGAAFAGNLGNTPTPQTYALATVPVATGAGTAPNNDTVILNLVPPFPYDPTNGVDLVIEISMAAGAFTGASGNLTSPSMDVARNAVATPVRGSRMTGLFGVLVGVPVVGQVNVITLGITQPASIATSHEFGSGCHGLHLAVPERMLRNTTLNLTVTNMPPGTWVTMVAVDYWPGFWNPPIDLGYLGMPACNALIASPGIAPVLPLLFLQPSDSVAFPLTLLPGQPVGFQAFALGPSLNAAGIVASNAVSGICGLR